MFQIQHPAKQQALPGFLGALVQAVPKAINDYTERQVAASKERTRQQEALAKLGIAARNLQTKEEHERFIQEEAGRKGEFQERKYAGEREENALNRAQRQEGVELDRNRLDIELRKLFNAEEGAGLERGDVERKFGLEEKRFGLDEKKAGLSEEYRLISKQIAEINLRIAEINAGSAAETATHRKQTQKGNLRILKERGKQAKEGTRAAVEKGEVNSGLLKQKADLTTKQGEIDTQIKELDLEKANVNLEAAKSRAATAGGTQESRDLNNQLTQERINKMRRDAGNDMWLAGSLGNAGIAPEEAESLERGEVSDEGVPKQLSGWFRDLTPQEKFRAIKTNPALVNAAQKEQELSFKERAKANEALDKSYDRHAKYISAVDGANSGANLQLKEFDNMETIIKSGKLTDSRLLNFFHFLHVPEGFLGNPANEVYQKEALGATRNLIAEYGNRPLLKEFTTLLQRIPTLMHTDAGKKRIIYNMKVPVLISKLKHDALDKIREESDRTGSPLPRDLSLKVDQAVQPQIKALFEQNAVGNILWDAPKDKKISNEQIKDILNALKENEEDKVTPEIIQRADNLIKRAGYVY